MVINYKNAFSAEQCSERSDSPASYISFMETNSEGFIGAYDPPADYLEDLLLENDKGVYATNVSLGEL